MKKNKAASLQYLASALFYVAALFYFTSSDNTAMGVLYLSLGSLWLCLGAATSTKAKDDGNEGDKT